jgi:hypothetical protein
MKKTNKRTKPGKKKPTNLFTRIVPNKWVALIFIAIIAGIGSYFVFFSEAAPNNCQNQDGVPICDVDLVAGLTDVVIGVDEEPQRLGRDGWGMYFGPAFRAPTKPINGAFPIYRVYNHNATLHDWVTGGQKAAKEAKYEGVQVEGVPFYAWDKQVPGTVPVYRISRGGSETKILLTSDKAWIDRILAVEANDPNGWRQNQFGEFIAFYAYPISYTVPGTVNPGDCSIAANLNNPECKTQKESLEGAIGTDALPTSNECPATIDKYLAAAFPSQFSQACQDKWNNFVKDCSKQENFLSDRCKTQRAQLESGLAQRAAIEAAAKEIAQRAVVSRSLAPRAELNKQRPGGNPGGRATTGLTPQEIRYLEGIAASQQQQRCPSRIYVGGKCYVPKLKKWKCNGTITFKSGAALVDIDWLVSSDNKSMAEVACGRTKPKYPGTDVKTVSFHFVESL